MQDNMGRNSDSNKKLAWHAKNMELIACRTANNRDTAYLWAIASAVLYILKRIERRTHIE